MSTNLASHHDPWTTEEVYCGRWEMGKMKSPKRMKGKGRGSCPQYEFERVLNLEEVDPKSFCMGGSNVHQPCFPSRSMDH